MPNIRKLLLPPALAVLAIGAVLVAPGLVYMPPSVAQSSDIAWVRQFGTGADDGATNLALTSQGDVMVVGWTAGVLPGETGAGAGRDGFVRKYTSDGSEAWSHQFGASGVVSVMAADTDNADNLLVGGQVRGGALPGQTPTGIADAFVRKYGPQGGEQWTRQFGAADGNRQTETAAGEVRAAPSGAVTVSGWVDGALPGQTSKNQASKYDLFVRNLDPGGVENWTTQFGTAGHDRPTAIAIDPAGNWIVTGQAARDASASARRDKSDPFVWTLDKSGQINAQVSLPSFETGNVSAISVTTKGVPTIAMAGQVTEEHGHAYLRKVDLLGQDVWESDIQIAGNDFATAVAMDDSGAVYVGGYMGVEPAPSTDVTHMWVQKYAVDGTLVWTRTLGTTNKDILSALAVTPKGIVYVAGWTRGAFPGQTNNGRSDAFVAKLQ